jgi:hypothetical protein
MCLTLKLVTEVVTTTKVAQALAVLVRQVVAQEAPQTSILEVQL